MCQRTCRHLAFSPLLDIFFFNLLCLFIWICQPPPWPLATLFYGVIFSKTTRKNLSEVDTLVISPRRPGSSHCHTANEISHRNRPVSVTQAFRGDAWEAHVFPLKTNWNFLKNVFRGNCWREKAVGLQTHLMNRKLARRWRWWGEKGLGGLRWNIHVATRGTDGSSCLGNVTNDGKQMAPGGIMADLAGMEKNKKKQNEVKDWIDKQSERAQANSLRSLFLERSRSSSATNVWQIGLWKSSSLRWKPPRWNRLIAVSLGGESLPQNSRKKIHTKVLEFKYEPRLSQFN